MTTPQRYSNASGGIAISPIPHTATAVQQPLPTPSSVWAPELDLNGLERQVNHYADEAVRAASKVQALSLSDVEILKAAAIANKHGGGNISPSRRSPDNQQQAIVTENPQWKSLKTLPAYILRLFFAAGQMFAWLANQNSSENNNNKQNKSMKGNFSHLVLPAHEGISMDPEKVVEYLTEFSEFPQIAELELLLHETMSEISQNANKNSPQRRTNSSINNMPHIRAVIPATEGELLSMSATQRAQLASDILACHRSGVVYAVRQWCFAIGRYLLLLDQWIRLHHREVRILSQERTSRNQQIQQQQISPTDSALQQEKTATSQTEEQDNEELLLEGQLEQTRSDLANTFREKFFERGGLQLLLESRSQTPANTSVSATSSVAGAAAAGGGGGGNEDNVEETTTTRSASSSSVPKEEQKKSSTPRNNNTATTSSVSHVGDVVVSPSSDVGASNNENNNNNNNNVPQQTQQQQNPSATSSVRPQQQQVDGWTSHVAVGSNYNTNNDINVPPQQQQTQQQQETTSTSSSTLRQHLISPPRRPSTSDTANSILDDITQQQNTSTSSNNVSGVMRESARISPSRGRSPPLSANVGAGGGNIVEPEERQRLMTLIESLRQELTTERSKRQEAEAINTDLRIEASRVDAKIVDATLRERQQAEKMVSSMKAQLDSALADAERSSRIRSESERQRDEMSSQLRSAIRNVEDAKSETSLKVQQLLQSQQRLEDTQRELREARNTVNRAESRAQDAERDAEHARISSSLARPSSTTPASTPARGDYSSQSSNVILNTSVGSATGNTSSSGNVNSNTGNPMMIRTMNGAVVLAAPLSSHQQQQQQQQQNSSVLGVYQGQSSSHFALMELQTLELQRRLQTVHLEELESRVAVLNLAHASAMHSLNYVSKKLIRTQLVFDSAEAELKSIRQEQQSNETSSNSNTLAELKRLRDENYQLQKSLQDTVFEMQSRTSSKSNHDEARIRSLETEFSTNVQKLQTTEENFSSFRLQAADTEQRLKSRYHEEQELRVNSEVALRNESEKTTKLLAELELLHKEKMNLQELHKEAVSDVRRLSSATDSSSKILSNRVSELESQCERYMRESEELRRQNRAISDEMAAVRRHNTTLDSQLSMTGGLHSSSAHTAQSNSILVDALKTKIEALESKERENSSSHQNTVAQLEQRLSKLRGELLSATESSEHTMFELRRGMQQQQLRADGSEATSKDWQRRCEETEKELETTRKEKRELSASLHENVSTRSDNEILKKELKSVEEELTKKQDEVIMLRQARTELSAKQQQAQEEAEKSKMERDNQIRIAQQTLQQSEKTSRKYFDEALAEAELRQQARFDKELTRVVHQLEELQKQDRESLSHREKLEGELSVSRSRVGQLESQNKNMSETIGDMRDMVHLLKKNEENLSSSSPARSAAQQQQHIPSPPTSPNQQQQKSSSTSGLPPTGAETLTTISSRVNIPIEELLAANYPNITSATTILPRGTKVILPPVNKNNQGDSATSAATSTTDLGPSNKNKQQQQKSETTPSSSSVQRQRSPTPPPSSSSASYTTSNVNVTSMQTSVLKEENLSSSFPWNSVDDLIDRLHLLQNVDKELLLQMNEKVMQSTDQPLPPGAHVVIPIVDEIKSSSKTTSQWLKLSLQQIRNAFGLPDQCIKLRDAPEPSDPSQPLPLGTTVVVCRSLQNPQGATIRQLALRLSMEPGALLEANPSVAHEDEIIPYNKTIFVPRREDPNDALSVSWRRSRARRDSHYSPTTGGKSNINMSSSQNRQQQQGTDDIFNSGDNSAHTSPYKQQQQQQSFEEEIPHRAPWTLDETSKRCGVSFEELMVMNSSNFPGTCRLPEDLLPHFVPFKFILRPFRTKVHPTRIQDVSRMLDMPMEDLLKANSGVSSGTALLWPGQQVRIPLENGTYIYDPRNRSSNQPLSVQQVALLLKLSPLEFLKDNQRSHFNLSENVTSDFYITVRDVDQYNFGDFVMQLGQTDPNLMKKKDDNNKKEGAKTNPFDRLRDAMDYGPREENFEDEEDLEEEAKQAYLKARRNSGKDYWLTKKKDLDVPEGHEDQQQQQQSRSNAWETGWVSRVSVHEQKSVDSARKLAELEEQERTSAARVRHLPLLSSSARRTSLSGSSSQQQGQGQSSSFVSNDNSGSTSNSPARPLSAAALYRLTNSTTPPPLQDLDNITRPAHSSSRPTSATALRSQIQAVRSAGATAAIDHGKIVPEPPARPPKKADLPDDLAKFIRTEISPTVKENTANFFDFNPYKKSIDDDGFRTVIELLSRKQCQSVVSMYFAGIQSVSPDAVLKGVAIMCAYGTKFSEFTTDPMQFPPSTMAQLKLLLAKKDELRQTKWIFESCLASQRSIIHLRGKKLTDASAVLLDALDEMHSATHGINIIDLRENFLTNGTGKIHCRHILKREWSPVTSILLDENPDLDEESKKELAAIADKKERKQLEWMAYQQQQQFMDKQQQQQQQPFSGSVSPMSRSTMSSSQIEGRAESPTQKRFLKKFSSAVG